MPRRAVHVPVGCIAGAVAAARIAREEPAALRLLEGLGGAAGGVLGALAPDWIEPATNPSHRGAAHSFVVLTGSGGPTLGLAVSDRVLSLPIAAEARQLVRDRSAEFLQASEMAAEPWRKVWFQMLALLVHVAAGFLVGLVAGYASHLALDLCSPKSLPVLAKGF